MKSFLKRLFSCVGLDIEATKKFIQSKSIRWAMSENGLDGLVSTLKNIVPDISEQESSESVRFDEYWELKRRTLQAFQCSLMLKTLEDLSNKEELTVVDVGDSAGTHMLYLRVLTKGRFTVDTISVNLDPRAIEKIRRRGLKAILCRAEDLEVEVDHVDLFTSFEMLEHLHNPSAFLRRLAKGTTCDRLLITVPYLRDSRVGLYQVRNQTKTPVFAEDEHIFELDPDDWVLLMVHCGWKVVHQEIYYQYPRKIPVLRGLLSWYWKKMDFEGFFGVILERDTSYSDLYQDWES